MFKYLVFFAVFFLSSSGVYIFAVSSKNSSLEEENYFIQESRVSNMESLKKETFFTGGDSIIASNDTLIFEDIGSFKITAYSSTVGQTDDTPFIMASGNHVYNGAVAANFLPLGTLVKFPELHGNKIFTVEDRMNKRFGDRIDIWFEAKTEAKSFGLKYTKVEIAR
jgi:3D (Asp-Asp-Asp) domain-containing protein